MPLAAFTHVPNSVFDQYLSTLTLAQLKVLLVIIRQTNGYGKKRDWISNSQMQAKTGLSNRSIASAITSLQSMGLIVVTNQSGREPPKHRNGAKRFFTPTLPTVKKLPKLSPQVNLFPKRSEEISSKTGNKFTLQKKNSTKEICTKEKSSPSVIFSPKLWITEKMKTYGSFEKWMEAFEALHYKNGILCAVSHPNQALYTQRFIPPGFPPLNTSIPYQYWKTLCDSQI